VSSHAKSSGIVDDDEVAATAFDELGADAGAGARGDDGVALRERGVEALAHFLARVGVSFSGPGVGHGEI